jgi:hypothetical protein
LIGTIEASIRAVEAAEEEMERYIELPKFADDSASRKWRDTEVEVKKVDVGGRIASMGAATAEVCNRFFCHGVNFKWIH